MSWKDAPLVESGTPAWAAAPVVDGSSAEPAPAETRTRAQQLDVAVPPAMRALQNIAGGAVRGAGSIGTTGMSALGWLLDKAGIPHDIMPRAERERAMGEALSGLGFDPGALAFGAGKLGGEIAGSAGVGGVLAAPLRAVAPPLARAVETAGFSTGLAGAPALANVGLRTAGGGVTGAASAGLVNPQDALAGGAVGAALPAALKASGAAGAALGRAVTPRIEQPDLAAKALQAGIPLGLADVSSGPLVRATRSVLNDLPITGGIGARQREAVQQGFNQAVGRTFGAEAPSLTPDVLDAARKRMGGEFDRLWNRNALPYDDALFGQVQALRAEAAKLPQGESARLTSWLDDIESKMAPGPNGELFMPGDVANRLQSKLGKEASRAQGFLKGALAELRGSMLGAFNRAIPAEDAAALAATRGQYKAYKTVEPLLQGAEAGVAGRSIGDVPAGLLPQAVRSSYGPNIAASPFADLSQIGSQFVADRVARTGGAPRALVQGAMTGALTGGLVTNPLLTLVTAPTALAGGALAQRVLGSPALAARFVSDQPSALTRLLGAPSALTPLLYRGAPLLATE